MPKLSFKKIKETCLYAEDLDKTKEFYHGKLGLEIIGYVNSRHIFFRAGESVLLCFIAEATRNDIKLPTHYGNGNLHFAFETTVEQYPLWKQKILETGITIEHEETWSANQKSFYFRDPDNHLAEIVMEGLWD